MPTNGKYWFPAKRYGYGWSVPTTWQGWLVLAVYVVLTVAATFLFPPQKGLVPYIASVTVLTAAFIAVCWLKGETPRWRWGDDERT
jgi:uncharacterized membrane protein YhaH (DUF805 family)